MGRRHQSGAGTLGLQAGGKLTPQWCEPLSHLLFQLISLCSQWKHPLEGAARCLLSSLESKLMTTGLNSFCFPVGCHPQGALDLKKRNFGSGIGEMRTAGRRQGWGGLWELCLQGMGLLRMWPEVEPDPGCTAKAPRSSGAVNLPTWPEIPSLENHEFW